jgi:hypothetical protein
MAFINQVSRCTPELWSAVLSLHKQAQHRFVTSENHLY